MTHVFEWSKALYIRERTGAHSTEVLSRKGDGSHKKQVWRVLGVFAPSPWLCSLLAQPGSLDIMVSFGMCAAFLHTALRLVESETRICKAAHSSNWRLPNFPSATSTIPTRDPVWEWE